VACWHCRQCFSRLSVSARRLFVCVPGLFITIISTLPSVCWCKRNDSRTMRLSRLRPTAKRQFFFEMASPSRGPLTPGPPTPEQSALEQSARAARYKTVNSASRLRRALPKTRVYAAASCSRAQRGKRLLRFLSESRSRSAGWLSAPWLSIMVVAVARRVTGRAALGPWHDGASAPAVRLLLPCARGSRGCACGECCWAGRYASFPLSRVGTGRRPRSERRRLATARARCQPCPRPLPGEHLRAASRRGRPETGVERGRRAQ